MAIYLLKDIKKEVRVLLDQNRESGKALVSDVETLSLNEIIEDNVLEAIKRVHSIAPPNLIDGATTDVNASIVSIERNGERAGGELLLPDDFMRLVVFKLEEWEQGVYITTPTESAEYVKQTSKFKGVRRTKRNPICFTTTRSYGRIIEFYPYYENANVAEFAYLPYPEFEDEGGEKWARICEKCYKAVLYMIASLVLISIGETDKSNVFTELSKTALL